MAVSQNYNPVQQVVGVGQAVGGAAQVITLLTAQSWLRLFSLVITYTTQAATTPTITFRVVDANGNTLWTKAFTALAAAVTSSLQVGNGMVDNVATPAAQQVGIPTDMLIPPGGKVQFSTANSNAADAYVYALNYGN